MEATVRPRLTAVATAIAVSLGIAATRAYFVEPKTSANGWTPRWDHVGQSFVANVDSIYYLEWFVGELSQPGLYEFEITQNGQFVCGGEESVPARGWRWIRCDRFTQGNRCFTKGREYVVKVSHSGGDSEV